MRMPDSVAKADPSIHENVVTAAAFVPTSPVRSRSLTTARVSRPRRVVRKKAMRPPAVSSASATMMSWSAPTLTVRNRNVPVGRKVSTRRVLPP